MIIEVRHHWPTHHQPNPGETVIGWLLHLASLVLMQQPTTIIITIRHAGGGDGGDDGGDGGVPGAGAPSLALAIAQARLLVVVSVVAACGDEEVRVEPAVVDQRSPRLVCPLGPACRTHTHRTEDELRCRHKSTGRRTCA
jgi:hypothetical protein